MNPSRQVDYDADGEDQEDDVDMLVTDFAVFLRCQDNDMAVQSRHHQTIQTIAQRETRRARFVKRIADVPKHLHKLRSERASGLMVIPEWAEAV